MRIDNNRAKESAKVRDMAVRGANKYGKPTGLAKTEPVHTKFYDTDIRSLILQLQDVYQHISDPTMKKLAGEGLVGLNAISHLDYIGDINSGKAIDKNEVREHHLKNDEQWQEFAANNPELGLKHIKYVK